MTSVLAVTLTRVMIGTLKGTWEASHRQIFFAVRVTEKEKHETNRLDEVHEDKRKLSQALSHKSA